MLLSVPIRCPTAEILNGTYKWHHRNALLIANLRAYWPHEWRRSGCSVDEFVISCQQRVSFKFLPYDIYKADRVSRQIRCCTQKVCYSDTCCKNDISLISQKKMAEKFLFWRQSGVLCTPNMERIMEAVCYISIRVISEKLLDGFI